MILIASKLRFLSSMLTDAMISILKKKNSERMLSNLMEGRPGAGNEYHGYSSADSLTNFRLFPSGGEENTYDHTDRGDYHILSLRHTSQRACVYDGQCPLMTSFHVQTPQTTAEISPSPDIEYLGINIEPECLINLFRESEDDLFSTVSNQEIISEIQSDSEKGNYENYSGCDVNSGILNTGSVLS